VDCGGAGGVELPVAKVGGSKGYERVEEEKNAKGSTFLQDEGPIVQVRLTKIFRR